MKWTPFLDMALTTVLPLDRHGRDKRCTTTYKFIS